MLSMKDETRMANTMMGKERSSVIKRRMMPSTVFEVIIFYICVTLYV